MWKRMSVLAVMVACGGSQPAAVAPARPPVAAVTPPADAGVANGVVSPPTPNTKIIGIFGGASCDGVKGNADAVAAFDKGCAAHDGQGCFELSQRYSCGAGVDQDQAKSLELADRACTYGNGPGCNTLATYYMGAGHDGIRALAAAQQGCKVNDPLACSFVGVFTWQGVGMTADPPRAAKLLGDQCANHNQYACANFSVMLYMGQGIARDLDRARQLGEQSCAAGMDAGCNIFAGALMERGTDDDLERAQVILSGACDRGGGPACDNLGQLYAHGGGRLKANPDLAKRAFQRACDTGNAIGCTHLGQLVSQ
jgi:hypothetical protein